MNYQLLPSFFIYFGILIAIGFFFYRKTTSARSFNIGNRSLNYWVAAISAQASDMSSWLFLGFPVAVYTSGIKEVWAAIGLIIFSFLNWLIVAPRLRVFTERYKSTTLPTFFKNRFSDRTNQLSVASSCIAIFFFICYISAGFVGLGRLFEGVFGIEYHVGIIIGMGITVAYTLIGGFLAVAWCNLFQGLFLLSVIITVPIIALVKLGGFAPIWAATHSMGLSTHHFFSPGHLNTSILLAISWGLGYFGQPHIIVNFMSIDDVRFMRRAMIVGTTWNIIALTAATLVGLTGIALFTSPLAHPEHLFTNMVNLLFTPSLAGFAFCGMLAAILSTINTQIIVSASSLAQDIYVNIIRPRATSLRQLWASRMSIIIISGIAFIVSYYNSTSVYTLTNYAWSGLGSAFAPTVLFSLYSHTMNRQGILCGIIGGALTAGVWPLLNPYVLPQIALLPLIPGFCINIIVATLVSRCTQK